jgi:hypothetical protein
MVIHDNVISDITYTAEEQEIIENQPDYLKLLVFDHSHLLIDYDNMVLLYPIKPWL